MKTLTEAEREVIRNEVRKLWEKELRKAFKFVNANPHLVHLYFNQHKEPKWE